MRKTTVALVFLLLAAAGARADSAAPPGTVLNFNYVDGFLTWTMIQGAPPDQGSFLANDFTYLMVPITDIYGRTKTFDVNFLLLLNPPFTSTTNLIMSYDPSSLQFDNIFWLQEDGFDGMWTANGFVPGTYARGGLTITEAPEPSFYVLLACGLLYFLALAGKK